MKTINTFLLIVFTSLVILFIYKSISTNETTKIQVKKNESDTLNTISREEVQLMIEQYFKENVLKHLPYSSTTETNNTQKDTPRKKIDIPSKLDLPKQKIFVNKGNIFLGNKDATVRIYLLYKYECKNSCNFMKILIKRVQEDQNLRLVLIPIALHNNINYELSKIALCLNKVFPEKFLKFHKRVLSSEESFTQEGINRILEELELPKEQIYQLTSEEELQKILRDNNILLDSFKVESTPYLLINNVHIKTEDLSEETLTHLINKIINKNNNQKE